MKTSLFGAMALLLNCGLALAQPAPPVKTEAQLIFDRCRTAYGDLQSYRGTTKTMNLSLRSGAPYIYSGSAKITFEKPGSLRVDGQLANGGNFSILGNAGGSWYRWALENKGNWKRTEQVGFSIATMAGVAANAPTTVSSLLTQPLDASIFRYSEAAKLEYQEQVGGEMCYKLTSRAPQETISWWISQKTLLLRRIVSYTSEEQSAAQLAEVEKTMKQMPVIAGQIAPTKLDMRFVSRVEDFEIEAINEPIDAKLFETPTPK